jgi:alkylhydroperoxidase/carboxymuconolactone decarboxylase family protein YurZ
MDEKTKALVGIAASVAGNCAPCFEHFYGLAIAEKACDDSIGESIQIGEKVKKGSHLAMMGGVRELLGGAEEPGPKKNPCACSG